VYRNLDPSKKRRLYGQVQNSSITAYGKISFQETKKDIAQEKGTIVSKLEHFPSCLFYKTDGMFMV